MGIKGLNKFIKDNSDGAFFMMAISQLKGKKIAVDAYGWMFSNMVICRQKVINRTDVSINELDKFEITKEFLLTLTNFILKWINNSITPIFVFDGKNKPVEKNEVKEERYQKQKEKKEEIDAIYENMKTDILANPASLISDLRKKLSNYNPIDRDIIETFKSFLDCIGIPWLLAEGDAEQLCSSLCIEGKVAAVFSNDTDSLAHGAPLVINGISKGYHKDEVGKKITMLDCVRLDKSLKGLNMTYQTFLDLCIMCGCDFNNHTNMKGYAAIKAYQLLLPYGNIDKIPKSTKYDITCLNHKRCREIFGYKPSEKLTIEINNTNTTTSTTNNTTSTTSTTNVNTNTNTNNINVVANLDINLKSYMNSHDYLNKVGIIDQLEKIYGTFQNFKGSSSGLIEELNLKHINLTCNYRKPLKLNIII
jgi:flap endonuclease-1